MSALLAVFVLISSLIQLSQCTYNPLPNFVFLFADDLGFNDVGWRGSTNIYTPNLDALRDNNAIELTRFYVTPKCSPTRSSFMTGRYTYKIGMQHNVGIVEFFTCGIEPGLESVFFTERLKTCAGYNNYYMGKWHLGEYKWKTTPIFRGGLDYFKGYLNSQVEYFNFSYFPSDSSLSKSYGGFYDWRENTDLLVNTDDNYTTTAFGEKALEIIRNIGDTNDDTPFTMIVSFEAPHGPVHNAPGFFWDDVIPTQGNTGPGGPYGSSSNDNYEERRQYVSMVYAMDYYIGEIVDALRDNDVNGVRIWDNTFVFFFSDNGGVITYASNYPLRGAKSTNFEGGIRVPAFITGGLVPVRLKGKSYDGLVHITDLYATTLHYANVSMDDLSIDGVSLQGLLNSPGNNINHIRDSFIITADEVDCNATYNGQYVCGGIIRDFGDDGIYKLVIGSENLASTGRKFGWGELDNQDKVNEYANETLGLDRQITCDPYDLGYEVPTYNNAFKESDCAPNNRPCLYKLDEDPCETDNKAENDTYAYFFDELMDELIDAYNSQEDPFWTRQECNQAIAEDVFDYMEANGYWTPFEEWFTGDSAFSKANAEIYTGVCEPTQSPTANPIIPEPTSNPTTGKPTVEAQYYYVEGLKLEYGKAKGYCKANYGTKLATISTDDERQAAIDQIGDEQVWFGLTTKDENQWRFLNGDECTNENTVYKCIDFWGYRLNKNTNYRPRCIGSDEKGKSCVYFDGEENVADNDIDCREELGFLCEMPESS